MSDDLVAFLRARLDEDEAAAMAASDGPWTPWRGRPGLGLRQLEHGVALPGQDSGSLVSIATASWLDAEHIARHDPARVLREVAAGRAILAEHAPGYPVTYPAPSGQPTCGVCHAGGFDWDPENWPCPTVRAMAAVYDGHPDYRQEWKP